MEGEEPGLLAVGETDWVWGRSCMCLLRPAGRRQQELREVAGNFESLRNVSRKEDWASGTRRNVQTRTLVRGRVRAREVVVAEQPLKTNTNKQTKKQKSNCPLHPPKSQFSGGKKLLLLSHTI